MPLTFPGQWRFKAPEGLEPIDAFVVSEFFELIAKVASQGNSWNIIEQFKGTFAGAVGSVHVRSSSEGWAATDLRSYMDQAARNPPLFIEALYSGFEFVEATWKLSVPDTQLINDICRKNSIPLEIDGRTLKIISGTVPSIPVPHAPPTLREETARLLEESVNRSEQLLLENHGREAVQEMLWVLESLATGFRGKSLPAGQVKGKYFNQIVQDIKKGSPGTTLRQALEWCELLHGYLSSPTGGGVRHGIDLNAGDPISIHEARFFCNLIRSYVGFLQAEHEK